MITFDAGTVARIMAVATILLVAASVLMKMLAAVSGYDTMHGLVRFVDLDAEMNLPTWYASVTLLVSSVILSLIGAAERATGARARQWFALSCIFLGLSVDEVGSFHEISIAPVRAFLGVGEVLYFAWVIPAAILVLIVALLYAQWFRALPGRTRKLMLVSGILFLGGSLGIETAGGGFISRGESANPVYIALATAEETFEMLGVLVWIYALLDLARARAYGITVQFSRAANNVES